MDILNAIINGFSQGVIFYPLVLSLALSYRLLKFPDISIEGTFALGGAAFGVILCISNSYFLAIPIAMLFSAIAGGVTALLHHFLRINKFLAGIIVVTALYSVIVRILGGSNISLLKFNLSTSYIQVIYSFASIFITLITYFFYKSKYGIKIRGASINPELSKSLGHKTGLLLVIGLAFNNAIAAISGVYFSLDAGFSDLKIGQGALIVALAALAIGERLIPKNKVSILIYIILSSIVGSIFYQILWAFALQLNIRASDLKILSAMIVVILFVLKRRNETDDEL
jgi:putative tryptophan/tyrosine transport system permease protein